MSSKARSVRMLVYRIATWRSDAMLGEVNVTSPARAGPQARIRPIDQSHGSKRLVTYTTLRAHEVGVARVARTGGRFDFVEQTADHDDGGSALHEVHEPHSVHLPYQPGHARSPTTLAGRLRGCNLPRQHPGDRAQPRVRVESAIAPASGQRS